MTALLMVAALVAPAPAACQTTACHRRVARREHRRKWRGKPWQHRYFHLPPHAKLKLRAVRNCETPNGELHDNATGRTHHGRYQWTLSTAAEAGFKVDPHTLAATAEGRAQEHVRAWWWGTRHGWGHWPICGGAS